MEEGKFIESINKFIKERSSYYEQWIYNEPIAISNQHNKKLERLQKVLHKIIIEFVTNFENYSGLNIIVSNKTKDILKELEDVPYNVGTYRTDFVYDEFKQPKLIEITCRFALNGLFLSAVMNNYAKKYHVEKLKGIEVVDDYKNIFGYISMLSGGGDVFILKGKDLKNESVLFKDIFRDAGKKVVEVHYTDILSYITEMKNGWIISELTLDEIESLDLETIKKISQLNITNDFRTVLLIHDKQFFSVLGNVLLQEACLTSDEIDFLKDYHIPTYHTNENKKYWKDARINKDNWILKHRSLGKSKSIYAGIVTSQEDWDMIFDKGDMKNFVLQKWIPQIKVKGQILEEKYNDYIVGSLHFFNHNYFGLGVFRSSSFPVTNVVDDRKSSSLVFKDDFEMIKKLFVNYIDS